MFLFLHQLLQKLINTIEVASFENIKNLNSLSINESTNFSLSSLINAVELGTIEGIKKITGLINSTNPEQYYRFTLGNPVSTEEDEEALFATFRKFSLLLDGISNDVDVELIADYNRDKIRQDEEVVAFSGQIGNSSESIDFTDLPEDVYYIRVVQKAGDTDYNLSLNIPPLSVPSDNAGNMPSDAKNLGIVNGNVTQSDFVGAVDSDDYYSFNLDKISDFSAQVNGLDKGNLVVSLGQDVNTDGIISFDEIIAISEETDGNEPGAINVTGLATGSYYLWLSRLSGNTNYTIDLSANPSLIPVDKAGSTLATAFNIDTLTNSIIQSDFVGNVDPIDYYRFTLPNPSGLTLKLDGLSADADLELSQDKNGDGIISSDEVINISETTDDRDENINIAALHTGEYFAKVSQYSGNTNYNLSLNPKTATGVDLQVIVTPIVNSLSLGDRFNYTVTVKNIGASNATGVILRDNLPLESVLDISAVTSKGTRSISSSEITANIGSLNVNESATLIVSGRSIGSGSTSSLIQVSSSGTDFNPDNNSVVQRFNVSPGRIEPADLELSLIPDRITATVNDIVTFKLTLANKGPGAATAIQVKNLLPQGLNFVSSSAQQGSYVASTGIWDVGNIAKDNTASLNIRATVLSGVPITNTAEVIAVSEIDPDSTPNNNNPNEDDQASVTINASTIVGTPNADNLVGTDGDDTILGLAGNDTINGGNGNDTIFGGAGVDLLFGGAGRDVFGYNSPTEGIDKINDFIVGEDRISISRAGFGGNSIFGSDSLAGGVLDISRFAIGSSATTTSQRFIYNNESGALFFDADGSGGTAQVRLAQLVGNPALTNASFSMSS
jgi:uncharacterized repeat protein (TIGR01451 family)